MPASRAGHQGQEHQGINTPGFCSLCMRRIRKSSEGSLGHLPCPLQGTLYFLSQLSPGTPVLTFLPCPVSLSGLSVLFVWRVDVFRAWRPASQVHCPFLVLSPQHQLLWGFLSMCHPMPGFCCCWHRTIPRSFPKNTAVPMRAPTPPKRPPAPGHPPLCLCLYPPGGEQESTFPLSSLLKWLISGFKTTLGI